MIHRDEGAQQSDWEVRQGSSDSPVVIKYGVLRKSGSYALKAIGITPGEPQALREECRNKETTGLSMSRQDGIAKSRFEFAKAKTQTKRQLAVSTSQGGPIAKGQSAEGIVDEKSVGKIPICIGTVEGRKGGRYRMVRQMVVVSTVMIFGVRVRMDIICSERHCMENPVWRVLGTLFRLNQPTRRVRDPYARWGGRGTQ